MTAGHFRGDGQPSPSLTLVDATRRDRHLCPVSFVGPPMNGAELAREWAETMKAAGMAARTIKERMIFLRSVERRTGMTPVALTAGAVRAFLGQDQLQPGTRRRYWCQFSAWFGWLQLAGYRDDSPLRTLIAPKEPKRHPRPVTIEQVDRMLRTRQHRRTRVMVLLGAFEGLRAHEIGKVRGEDLVDGELHVIGKGGRERWVPIDELVSEAADRMPQRGWWFPSHKYPDRPVIGQSVSEILSSLMTRADVPGTPHSLRHFFATELLRSSGGNYELVRQALGHAHMSTTAIYTLIERDQMRAAIAGMPRPGSQRRPLRAA